VARARARLRNAGCERVGTPSTRSRRHLSPRASPVRPARQLASRWSPIAFDQGHTLTPAEVDLLLEAARWAPSAGNSQPWAFIAARRGDDLHRRLVKHLAGSSARWAPEASALVANLSHRYVEGTVWEYSEFAHYDLGQAVAHMTFQAQSMGLFVRQFRAFDRAGLTREFAVPPHWEVTTMSAFGRPSGFDADGSEAGRERQRRSRAGVSWPARHPPR
jgi:nitroreductase